MIELSPGIAALTAHPVAILGWGVSGQAVEKLLRRMGVACAVYSEGGGEDVCREFALCHARQHRLVIFSPGFSPPHPWLQVARKAGCLCLAELDFAALFWKGKTVAVTGTNGKTTLTEFLAYAYQRNTIDAIAVGNNGYPLSRLLAESPAKNGVAVCEASSFQAERLQYFRADALIWTNFSEDHLDRHITLRDYFAAKWNLVERLSRPLFFAGKSVAVAARKYNFPLPEFTTIVSAEEEKEWAMPEGSAFASVAQHENLCLARRYGEREGFPETVFKAAAESFPPRPHRLRKIAELESVEIWNDSKGTNFSATLAALENFDQPVLWIGGGKSNGGDIGRFSQQMASKVKAAFLLGETAPALAAAFRQGRVPLRLFNALPETVSAVFETAEPGDVILFSPGFASQDMFDNYVQRGTCFENAVLSLKKDRLERNRVDIQD